MSKQEDSAGPEARNFGSFRIALAAGTEDDITQRNRRESLAQSRVRELEDSLREKDRFLAILAHDLRSPLSGFLGLTRILAQDAATLGIEEIQECANALQTSATNVYKLLENLLEWTEAHQGRGPLQPGTIVLRPLVSEGIALLEGASRQKRIEVRNLVPTEFRVKADSWTLQALVRNLLSNAIKFTPPEGWVEISACPASSGFVRISISDNGIGIEAEHIEKLFRIDQKMSRLGTQNEIGTGLGLLLCKEYIEKNGGRIEVESVPNRGTTFYLTLPGDE